MIDFRSINIEINRLLTSATARTIEDGERDSVPFNESGNLFGRQIVRFDSRVNRFEVAIKSFHFETKNDHHISKLKLEPNMYRIAEDPTRVFNIDVRSAFSDDSPEDDFDISRAYIMSVSLLIIVDRD